MIFKCSYRTSTTNFSSESIWQSLETGAFRQWDTWGLGTNKQADQFPSTINGRMKHGVYQERRFNGGSQERSTYLLQQATVIILLWNVESELNLGTFIKDDNKVLLHLGHGRALPAMPKRRKSFDSLIGSRQPNGLYTCLFALSIVTLSDC